MRKIEELVLQQINETIALLSPFERNLGEKERLVLKRFKKCSKILQKKETTKCLGVSASLVILLIAV